MRRLTLFLLLFVFWLIFSGHFDAFHISLGLACCALVSAFSADLVFPEELPSGTLTKVKRFVQFMPWLLYQIVLANLHVVYLVVRPDRLRPQVVRVKTRLTSDLARVTLGNSITLTPGTITMDIEDDELIVHAISEKSAVGLQNGEMELRIGWVFLEGGDHAAPASPPAAGSARR